MHQSLEAGRPRRARPRRHLRRRRRRAARSARRPSRSRSATVDEIVRVTNDEICAAIKDVFDDTRAILEPAGALAVAGLKTWVARSRARRPRLVAVLSGANMNFDRLRFVAERAELGEAREALFAVTIPERPGAFRDSARTSAARRDRVQLPAERPPRGAHLRRHRHPFAGRRRGARSTLLRDAAIAPSTSPTTRSPSCTSATWWAAARRRRRRAALPLRVSRTPGRAHAVPRHPWRTLEHQPVPLSQPRRGLRPRARGFEVPPADEDRFAGFLHALGYRFQREQDNAAYEMFLK